MKTTLTLKLMVITAIYFHLLSVSGCQKNNFDNQTICSQEISTTFIESLSNNHWINQKARDVDYLYTDGDRMTVNLNPEKLEVLTLDDVFNFNLDELDCLKNLPSLKELYLGSENKKIEKKIRLYFNSNKSIPNLGILKFLPY